MKNIEIKAPVADGIEMARRVEAFATKQGTFRQVDTFFTVPRGYLKLREIEGRGGELIAYVRESGTGPRTSDYVVAALPDPRRVKDALTRSLGLRGRVE